MCYFKTLTNTSLVLRSKKKIFVLFSAQFCQFVTHGKLCVWFQVSLNKNNIWNIISVLLLIPINHDILEPGERNMPLSFAHSIFFTTVTTRLTSSLPSWSSLCRACSRQVSFPNDIQARTSPQRCNQVLRTGNIDEKCLPGFI